MEQIVSVHYFKDDCIVVINGLGRLRTLYTPFKVVCTEKVENFTQNTQAYVEEVGTTEKDELLYYIGGRAYLHKHFRISASF